MRTLLFLISFVTGALLPLLACANNGIETVSLEHALMSAMSYRPKLLAAEEEVNVAISAHQASQAQALPRLTLSERFYATNEPAGSLFISLNQESLELSPTADSYNNPPDRHDFETRLSLDQTIFDPEVYYGRKKTAVRQAVAKDLLKRSREDIAFQVLNAYLQVQQAKANVAWAREYMVEAEELLSVARLQEDAGLRLSAETLRAQVVFNDAKRSLLVSENELKMARSELAFSIGRPQGEVDILSNLDPNWLPLHEPSEQIQRADLQALTKNVVASQISADEQQAAYLPKAGLQASYIFHDEDMPFGLDAEAWSVSANLEWTIFDFSERSHLLDQAHSYKRILELEHDDRRRQARLSLKRAVFKAHEAEAVLGLAETSCAASEATRQVIFERYSSGLATLAELLDIQSELAQARTALTRAQVGLIASRANIHYQEGTLLEALYTPHRDMP